MSSAAAKTFPNSSIAHRIAGRLTYAHLALLAWFVFAVVLIASQGGEREFWFDEILTYERIQLGWGKLAKTVYKMGAHSPLYFWMLKLYSMLPGVSMEPGTAEAALRFPSAVMMAAAGALLMHALLRIGERWAAVVLGVLWLSWPMVLRYGTEARPYAMLVFFTALGVWGAIVALHEASRRKAGVQDASRSLAHPALLAAGIGALGAAATMPLGMVAALVLEAGVLLAVARGAALPEGWRRHCLIVWPLLLVIAGAFLPGMMFKAVGYWTDTQELNKLSLDNIARVLLGVLGPQNGGKGRMQQVYAAWPFLVLAVYMLVSYLRVWRGERKPLSPVVLLVFGTFAVPALLCLASLNTSVLVDRYFIPTLCFSLPLYALWMAWPRRITGRVLSLAALCSALFIGYQAYSKVEVKPFAQIRSLMKMHGTDRAILFSDSPLTVNGMQTYLRDITSDIYFDHSAIPYRLPGVIDGRPSPGSTYWVVRLKRDFTAAGSTVRWVEPHLQCHIPIENFVVTVVVAQAEHLKPIVARCVQPAGI